MTTKSLNNLLQNIVRHMGFSPRLNTPREVWLTKKIIQSDLKTACCFVQWTWKMTGMFYYSDFASPELNDLCHRLVIDVFLQVLFVTSKFVVTTLSIFLIFTELLKHCLFGFFQVFCNFMLWYSKWFKQNLWWLWLYESIRWHQK